MNTNLAKGAAFEHLLRMLDPDNFKSADYKKGGKVRNAMRAVVNCCYNSKLPLGAASSHWAAILIEFRARKPNLHRVQQCIMWLRQWATEELNSDPYYLIRMIDTVKLRSKVLNTAEIEELLTTIDKIKELIWPGTNIQK